MSKSLLIINYNFPPTPGIGGRRWAKFTKYLAKDGYELFVIGALNREAKKSAWSADVENNDRIHYFPVKTKFFNFFHNYSPTFLNKVAYKLSKFRLELFSKGNFYDKAIASNQLFYKTAKELITANSINNIVITIAPNRLVEVGLQLKKDFPNINLMIDVRDPWNICNEEWDQKYLTTERKEYELTIEKKALQAANKVFTVSDFITDHYASLFSSEKKKFVTIPNGYDTDEVFASETNTSSNKERKKNIVFAGTLYDNVTNGFEEFVIAVNELTAEMPEIFSDIQFQFYIHHLPQFEKIVSDHKCKSVHFFDHLPLSKIQEVISQSYACMLFLSPNYEFSLSTKFFEYLSKNKKILVFSKPGSTPDLIQKNNLGYVMTPSTIKKDLHNAITELAGGKYNSPHTFDIGSYTIENITNSLKQYFI